MRLRVVWLVSFVLLVAASLTGPAALAGATSQQTLPRVSLLPVASRIEYSSGPFSIFVGVSDLDYHGHLSYDDNRDTVPDREQPSNGLGAFEVLLHYDPSVVRVESATGGPFIATSGRSVQCLERRPDAGQYAVGCLTTGTADGAQGSGTLATITLRPVANGTSYLALDAQISGPLGDAIPAAGAGGVVEVRGGPATAPTPAPGEQTGDSQPRPVESGTAGGAGASSSTGASDGNSPAGAAASGAPSSGTGYRPFGNDFLTLAGVLALAGGLLLLIAVRVADVRRS